MSIDTINVVYIDVKKKETYMKVIVSIDIKIIMSIHIKIIMSIHIKIIMSIHIITASLSTTQLAVLGGDGGWGTTQTKACVGGEGQAARYASASSAS